MADLTLGGGVVVEVAAPTQPVITMAPPTAPSPVLVVPVVGPPSTIPGDDGNGIASIARTSGDGSPGTVDTYTITYDDATTSEFYVTNGEDGPQGDPSPSNVMQTVLHGADASAARPPADAVYWVGSAEPTNATDNDLWMVTT